MPTPLKLNRAQVCEVFGISNVSLLKWRQGSPKRSPLPSIRATAKQQAAGVPVPVMFLASSILVWAKRNKVVVVRQPEDVVKNAPKVPAGKAGPKPVAVKEAN